MCDINLAKSQTPKALNVAPGRIRLKGRAKLIEIDIDIRVISICGSKPLSSKT